MVEYYVINMSRVYCSPVVYASEYTYTRGGK